MSHVTTSPRPTADGDRAAWRGGITVSRRRRRAVLAVLSMLLLVAVVAVGGPDDTGADEAAVESDLPGDRFELFDGGLTGFDEFDDGPLVINFWASWCPACVAELPEFQAVGAQRVDEVTILGIANTDIRSSAVALADDVGITYTLADDPEGVLFRALGLVAMPSTVFVAPGGEIVEVFAGVLDADGLNARIDQLVQT
jgi:thiol-disulfide isomerase/thioredoxin